MNTCKMGVHAYGSSVLGRSHKENMERFSRFYDALRGTALMKFNEYVDLHGGIISCCLV